MANRLARHIMNWNRKQNIERRLEKLETIFPPQRGPSREKVIQSAALQQLSEEDLLTLRRMSKVGWPRPSNEGEDRALAAYRSAVAAIRVEERTILTLMGRRAPGGSC